MHFLTSHRQKTFDELSIEQDEYSERFNVVIHKLVGVGRDVLFAKFEEAWRQEPVLGQKTWRDATGIFGENILHWINLRRPMSGDNSSSLHQLLFDLSCEIMDRAPSLMNEPFNTEPYTGEALLHMAIGNSDEEIVSEILRRKKYQSKASVDLDLRATGSFFTNPSQYSRQTKGADFVTPLCVAMIAPQNDETAISFVKDLIEAGASLTFKNPDGSIHSTALHHLAIARWSKKRLYHHDAKIKEEAKDEGHLTTHRLTELLHLLLRYLSPNPFCTHYGLTPLELAAQVGNAEFVNFLIRKEAVVMWKWGTKIEMRFSLAELDSSGDTWEQTSVTELLVLHKHRTLLCHGIFVDILEHKWQMFGKWIAILQAIAITLIVGLVTIGCLGAFDATTRMYVKIAAFAISCLCLTCLTAATIMARKCQWLQRLSWRSKKEQLSILEVGVFHDFLILVMAIGVCTVHLWEDYDEVHNASRHRAIFIFIDEFTAVFIYIGWVDLLRFMTMFKTTGNIVASLPKILAADMLPWMIVYCVVLVATTGAIRVALAHTVKEGHPNYAIVGTFYKTALTLEEATHGPDVSWRALVIHSPIMSAIFFLIFLWVVTIVLFNILIAMFTDTFDRIREHSFRERMHARAVTLITWEKLMPSWLQGMIGLPMGLPYHHVRGSIRDKDHFEDVESDGTPGRPKSGLRRSRWLPIEQDFENEMWDRPLKNSVLW